MGTKTIYDDPRYWGHSPVAEHLSNYSRVGGFRPEIGRPDLFAHWVAGLGTLGSPTPPPKVLEVGCAAGDAVAAMRRLGLDAYGLDVSSYILDRAGADVRSYLGHGDLTRILGNEFVTRLAPFDFIVSKDVLEHVEYREIHFVLADCGRLCAQQAHIVNTGQHDYQAWDGDTTHRIRENLDWWIRTAEVLGLRAKFLET